MKSIPCTVFVSALALSAFAGSMTRPVTAGAQERSGPTLDTVLSRAAAYVSSFEVSFASAVLEEALTQRTTDRGRPRNQQTTRADLLLLRVPGRDEWQQFRDVFEVNGRAVRNHDDRLRRLFIDAPATALDTAQKIAAESSRYNIGSVVRTIDLPTFGLMLLKPNYRARMRFSKRGEESVSGTPTWRIDYVEQGRTPIVRTLRRTAVPLEGSVWVEPRSGAVLKTLVKVKDTPDPGVPFPANGALHMWVLVTFVPDTESGLYIPDRMDESAAAPDLSTVTAGGTYSNLRRFEVETSTTFRGSKQPG